MAAYSEAYLQEVAETQGKLFDRAAEFVPGLDVEDFIRSYMASGTRKSIDRAQAYVCTMDEQELWEYFLKTDHFHAKKGTSPAGFMPDWIGQFYAYFQWYYNVPSSRVLELVPLEFMVTAYHGLHDLDMPLAVKKVGKEVFKDEHPVFS